MLSVAFLGLGAIGLPMARRLAGSFPLAVWNRTRSKALEFETTAAVRVAQSPQDCVRDADVVITCLSTSADVESLLYGEQGMLEGLRNDSVLIDCTSGDPATSRRIATRLAEAGVEFLDAPVSGGVTGAQEGKLTVMCGGDVRVLDRVRPVFAAFAGKVVHCGAIGTGDAVKAANQALLAVHIWSAGEALVALSKAGVPASVALEVINASSGRSNSSQNLFPERVLGRKFPRTFRLALLDKDVGIAAGFARENSVPSPMIELAAALFREAHAQLGEEADHVEAVKLIEKRSGVEIS
ncbi:MAG: NAD(P)-dependent oxidoreductase [Anaerolineae bacterium]|nr:NAD(P)-dependent oxidoreductase [Gemmatimonadaceae bacterium]